MLTQLDDAATTVDPEPFAGPDHPMRKLTRSVAFEGKWPPERAQKVAALFNDMAAEWVQRDDSFRQATVVDALERGVLAVDGDIAGQRWVELGSGTGAGTRVLADHNIEPVAIDIAEKMLRNADKSLAPQVLADASHLPIGPASVDAVLCVNMLLFPAEVDRVLAPNGRLVWVNSLGDQTPIHLPAQDVLDALPGEWQGTTARAGSGFWLVAQRCGVR